MPDLVNDGLSKCKRMSSVSSANTNVTHPRSNSVRDIVSTVSEGSCACRENLDEGVAVLDLVWVLGSPSVNSCHAVALSRAGLSGLCSMDIVLGTVGEGGDELGDETVAEDDTQVAEVVPSTVLQRVSLECFHLPSKDRGVGLLLGCHDWSFLDCLLLGVLGRVDFVLAIERDGSTRVAAALNADNVAIVVLDNPVVGHERLAFGTGIGGRLSLPEKRTHEEVVPSDSVVLFDDLGVDVGHPEDKGKDRDDGSGENDTESSDSLGLFVETKRWSTFIDDGHGTDCSGQEEEEGTGVDGPSDGILALEDDKLDEKIEDSTESSS